MKRAVPIITMVAVLVLSLAVKKHVESIFGHGVASGTLALKPAQASYQVHSLERYNLGFQSLISSLIWIQLLQKSSHKPLGVGKVSWEFTQVDAMTTLDPKFQSAFRFGAILLSVLRQDKLGALLILEKWVRLKPNFWQSHYLLGHHLYYELRDFDRGAKHILKAAGMPGSPYFLSSLGIRILSQSGALLQALYVSLDFYETVKNAGSKERLALRIRSLNYTLQKLAWEKALKIFRRTAGGEPKSLTSVKSLAQTQWRETASMLEKGNYSEESLILLSEKFVFDYDPNSHKIVPRDRSLENKLEKVGIFVHPEDKVM